MERKVENFKNFNKIPLYIYVALNFILFIVTKWWKFWPPKRRIDDLFDYYSLLLLYSIIYGFANIFEGAFGRSVNVESEP